MIWTFIKADQFFPNYAPAVKNYKQKISGKSTRGNPLDFSEADKKVIEQGLDKMYADMKKSMK